MTRWQRFVFEMRQFMFNVIAKSKKDSAWNSKRFDITQRDLWPGFLWKGMPFEDIVQFTQKGYIDGWISSVSLTGHNTPNLSLDVQPWPDEKHESMKLLSALDELRAGHHEGRDDVPLHEVRGLVETDIHWLVRWMAMDVYKFRDVFVYLFTDEQGVEHLRFRELAHAD